MRVVLDTNIYVSALIVPRGVCATVLQTVLKNRVTLLTLEEQIEEFRKTLQKPKFSSIARPHQVGRFVNILRGRSKIVLHSIPIRRSTDPNDDFLLEIAVAGEADLLVTGDKMHLLALVRQGKTRIVSVSDFATMLR